MRAGGAAAIAVAGIVAAVVLDASPAAAHGVGGRTDLPLPLWLFTNGAAIALLVSFVALRALWPRPRLAAAAEGRRLPEAIQRAAGPLAVVARAAGLGAFLVVLSAAIWGVDSTPDNLAPVAVYVVFWVGIPIASVVLGDVWRVLNPFDTLAALAGWARARVRTTAGPRRDDPAGPSWTAPVLLFSFVWLELAYVEPSRPRAVAAWLVAYSAVVLGATARWGRGWLRHGEGFTVLFGLLAHIAPLSRDERGTLRLRPPLSGLAHVEATPAVTGVIVVALGSTTFDGLGRTEFWLDVIGGRTDWQLTALNTVGLVWVIGIVWLAYQFAVRAAARIGDRSITETSLAFVASLVPIVFAYAVAHYFSLLVFEGQGALALASDPYGRAWNLFGTADNTIDYRAVSTATIAYVQVAAIVVGHVAAVVSAHDRSVELWPRRLAERTQYPMLAVMIAYTVGGLAILLGG
ncbi:MAG: hypothetical protein ACLFXM_11670 [Acidimicrobiia bacterium]